MARFYRLQLGGFYFTSNGLESGLPCKLELLGVDGFLSNFAVSSVDRQNDGSVKLQTVTANKKGVELTANLLGSIKAATFNEINDLIQEKLESGSTLILTGTGLPRNFSIEVVALTPTTKGFSGDRIKGASFSFITV